MDYRLANKITLRVVLRDIAIILAVYCILHLVEPKAVFLLFLILVVFFYIYVYNLFAHWQHKNIITSNYFKKMEEQGFRKEVLGEYYGMIGEYDKMCCRIFYSWQTRFQNNFWGAVSVNCFFEPPTLPKAHFEESDVFFKITYYEAKAKWGGILKAGTNIPVAEFEDKEELPDLKKMISLAGILQKKLGQKYHVGVGYYFFFVQFKYIPFWSKHYTTKRLLNIMKIVKNTLEQERYMAMPVETVENATGKFAEHLMGNVIE